MPTVIFAIASLFAGAVALLLPETKDLEMLEHVDEVEEVAARIRSASQHADAIKAALKNSELRKGSIKLNELGSKESNVNGDTLA